MGVDYDGHYGLGYRVNVPELEEDHYYFEDPIGFIENALEESNYCFFQIGDGSYSGEEDDVYIVLNEPFEDGNLDVTQKAKELKEFILSKGIEIEGEFDVVGGLRVW